LKEIYLEKARRNIRAAQLLFENELYDESANRAYYAAFQAALAALSVYGFQIERISHEGAQSVFKRELIHRRKFFPGKFKSYLLGLCRFVWVAAHHFFATTVLDSLL
jgi:hypothetical protein